ncbi:S53 family peptidase [Streptomyces sp. NPDC048278]|uniref:S53 family peptidase n=1 Tax=Streptomyces sp. NPDC048278 TaxID=3155809 RepID=UPI003431BA43
MRLHRSVMSLATVAVALAVSLMTPTASNALPGAAQVTRACAAAGPGTATCYAEYLTKAFRPVTRSASADTAATAVGPLTPDQIRAAYGVDGTAGSGRTVAIVDAYDDPNAESDLATYRSAYGIPACTTANGCFRKVNQRGAASPVPAASSGWATEISLDLDAVSAVCPACDILLVEADSSALTDLGAAENTAAALGATVISDSWGSDEFAGMPAQGTKYFEHPGVPVLAATGDSGFQPASFPAVLANVIGVGGTTITSSSNARGWTETAWSGAGSACSAYIDKPSFQKDTHCLYRTVADISAMADPDSGLTIYDTYRQTGWFTVGGTSLATPLVAAMIAMSSEPEQYSENAAQLYDNASRMYDVIGGSNGYCGEDYLCTAVEGYDGPTGIGTPDAAEL